MWMYRAGVTQLAMVALAAMFAVVVSATPAKAAHDALHLAYTTVAELPP